MNTDGLALDPMKQKRGGCNGQPGGKKKNKKTKTTKRYYLKKKKAGNPTRNARNVQKTKRPTGGKKRVH